MPIRRASRVNLTNVRRGLRGLGGPCMSANEIRGQLQGMQNCGPRDVGCVLCNQQLDAAVGNYVDGGCLPPGTQLSFSCDTSDAAIQAFQNNTPFAPQSYANGVLDTGRPAGLPPGVAPDGTTLGVALPGGGFTSLFPTGYVPPAGYIMPNPPAASAPASAAAPVVVQSSAPPSNPAPSVGSSAPPVGSAAGSTGGAASTAVAAASSGFDLSGIPTWGYLAAAGLVAVLVLGGKH